ncbi:MAG: hypothetical protein HQM08_08170 [Candidatus Riflebacteria bacterium]|nr:hypothetical protein [Candidatus Riflebacteria bacterium]
MKRIVNAVWWLLLGCMLMAGPTLALHPFYEQNGDCYMLIGDGPYRGVYALNNLTGGTVTRLYDPLDAYGITANQVWDGSACQKYLYTFAGQDTGWTPVTGNISRQVNTVDWKGAKVGYPGERTDEKIITYYHCGSTYKSATGIGPHGKTDFVTSNYMMGIYGYDGDYPCFWLPTPDPSITGNCLIPVGKYYHSFIRVRDYTSYYGGWTHWVVRENIQAKYRLIDLYNYYVNKGIGPTDQQSVATVITAQQSTMDEIHECPDGCSRAQSGIPLPGSEMPYVSCVYSTRLNNAYLYRREPSKTTYLLLGTNSNSKIVGDPQNLTTKSIGISSRDSTSDFVYTIGKDIINQWLKDANAPFTINQLDDVAVSDQWWLTGGIVYALDKSQKKVYKFVRDEISNTPSIPEQIIVYDGAVVPDSIKADGFGNLFLVKTKCEPDNPPDSFQPKDASSYVKQVDYYGNVTYRAYFNQNVYKAVSKRDYYSKVFTDVPGKILLGTNTFYRDFKTNTPTILSSWVWLNSSTQYGPVVTTAYRTELAVINSSTPPQVSQKNAITDINGPLISTSSGLQKATPDTDGFFKDTDTYIFAVENAPYFDINGVNVGSTHADQNGNGRIGDFPSTTKKSSVNYFWKVIQTKDLYGNVTAKTILDLEAANSPSQNYLLPVKLGGGEYRIGVKVSFQFYDYDKLPLGSLSDKKETVLSDVMTGQGEDAASYSWGIIKIKQVPPVNFPGGWCVIMSGRPTSPAGTYDYRPIRPTDAATPQCSLTNQFPPGAKFVIPEKVSDWSIKLRECDYNSSKGPAYDRIQMILSTNPPDPQDPRMVTGSLQWMDKPKFTWTSSLTRGTEGIVTGQIISESETLSLAQVKALVPVPSQPRSYKVKVNGGRSYQYQTFIPITTYVAGELFTDYKQMTMQKSIDIYSECDIVVTDETPPQLIFPDPFISGNFVKGFFFSNDLLYGTTGETLANAESSPTTNPSTLQFVVADNNPMGNDTASDDVSLLTYSDPFHFSSEPRCKVNHSIKNRYARFNYNTAKLGPIPPSSTDTSPTAVTLRNEYGSNPNQQNGGTFKVDQLDLTSLDFNKTWLPAAAYNKAFSYRMYNIPVSDLEHFSSLIKSVDSPKMDLTYANNSPGYKNLRFGIEWTESCTLATSPYLLGQIVIRDNDRPNLFIQGKEAKNPDFEYYCPTNLTKSCMALWTFLAQGQTEEIHNGVINWDSADIAGINPSFKINIGSPTTNGLLTNTFQNEFETDVPVFFTASFSDNIGSPTLTTFQLIDSGNTTLASVVPPTNTIRYLFRKADTVSLVAQVKDTAVGWPNDPYNNPTIANATPNIRQINCTFKVYATKLDVRVLDRMQNGK